MRLLGWEGRGALLEVRGRGRVIRGLSGCRRIMKGWRGFGIGVVFWNLGLGGIGV